MNQSAFESLQRIHSAAKALLVQTGKCLEKIVFTREYQVAAFFEELDEVLNVISAAIFGNAFEKADMQLSKDYHQACGYSAFQSQEYRLKNLMTIFKHAHAVPAKIEAAEILKKAFRQYCYFASRSMDMKLQFLQVGRSAA